MLHLTPEEPPPVCAEEPSLRVPRWPTELPWLAAVALVSLLLWTVIVLSGIGLVYALFVGVFLFLSHLGFIAHLRGSAVRLGGGQFPDLHAHVLGLARRLRLPRMPEVYILQGGGLLNAMATRFLRSHCVVLYSDLLEACGGNTEARDMIIGHELGHIRAGHLRWRWFLAPGLAMPVLGHAYSRAREYTCDRYGAAVCVDRFAALRGLAILAGGASYGSRADLASLAGQARDLQTIGMTLGRWFMTHPPLSMRIAALDPALAPGGPSKRWPAVAAWGALLALIGIPYTALFLVFAHGLFPLFRVSGPPAEVTRSDLTSHRYLDITEARQQAQDDLDAMADAVELFRTSRGHIPRNEGELYEAWDLAHPNESPPSDPFDGERYGYEVRGAAYRLWSAGTSLKDPADDIVVGSEEAAAR